MMYVRKDNVLFKNQELRLDKHTNFFKKGKDTLIKFKDYSSICLAMGLLLLIPSLSSVLIKAINPEQYISNNLSMMTVFFQLGTTERNIQDLKDELLINPNVDKVKVIWADTALAQIGSSMGIQALGNKLGSNPLPHVIYLKPKGNLTLIQLKELYNKVKLLTGVSKVSFDIHWLQRVIYFWEVLKYFFYLSSGLLAFIIIILVEQRISLQLGDNNQEIKLMRLLGSTKYGVSVSYLYKGLWLGLFAGLITATSTELFVWLLQQRKEYLSGFFDKNLDISLIATNLFLWIIIFAIILSCLGTLKALKSFFRKEELL